MSGKFSSAEQASEDSSYYDISLIMHPIWESDMQYKWLYVEQAVSQNMASPYRQRIYQLLPTADRDVIESRVYELPSPEDYVFAWKQAEKFDKLKPTDLMVRQGCSVYLKKSADGCYRGATNEKDCQSQLRGASYATSVVEICAGQVLSWDQGWNSEDEQVWGATKAGYIFVAK